MKIKVFRNEHVYNGIYLEYDYAEIDDLSLHDPDIDDQLEYSGVYSIMHIIINDVPSHCNKLQEPLWKLFDRWKSVPYIIHLEIKLVFEDKNTKFFGPKDMDTLDKYKSSYW
jgi:hypothetical protein